MSTLEIEMWETAKLRPHPENARIFGDPSEAPVYSQLLASIKKHDIREPLCIKAQPVLFGAEA